jgi:hypothetical protein
LLPLIGIIGSTNETTGAEKSDHKCDHGSGSTSQGASSSRSNWHPTENDATPRQGKGLSATDTDCHQRGRRGSNPQPPDRQSGTLSN